MPEYRSTLKARALLYLELKKAATLYLQGFSSDDIIRSSVEENLFAMTTESRKREVAVTLSERLEVLDHALLERLAHGNLTESRHIALYAIMKTDRLFSEFMFEVFREKLILLDRTLAPRDFAQFFMRKAEQSDVVAGWAEYTYYKLEQVYRKVLVEAGLAEKRRRAINIAPAELSEWLTNHIRSQNELSIISSLLGGA